MATYEEKIDGLVTDVAQIKTALTYDGTGLIPVFQKHCVSDEKFREDYYRFKRNCLTVFYFLLGAGVLTTGGIELAKHLGG